MDFEKMLSNEDNIDNINNLNFNLENQTIEYDYTEPKPSTEMVKLSNVKAQCKLMNDVVQFLGELNRYTKSFNEETNFTSSFNVENINYNFDTNKINIDMKFSSENFNTKDFLNDFINGYDKNFEDFEFSFNLKS